MKRARVAESKLSADLIAIRASSFEVELMNEWTFAIGHAQLFE